MRWYWNDGAIKVNVNSSVLGSDMPVRLAPPLLLHRIAFFISLA